jgi:hypothetical protein
MLIQVGPCVDGRLLAGDTGVVGHQLPRIGAGSGDFSTGHPSHANYVLKSSLLPAPGNPNNLARLYMGGSISADRGLGQKPLIAQGTARGRCDGA